MSVQDLQRLFDDLEVVVSGGGGTGATEVTLANLRDLVEAVVDVINGRIRTEINVLDSTEDSITVVGDNVVPYSEVVTSNVVAELVAAPGAGSQIVVKAFSFQLLEDTDTVVALRDGSAGGDLHVFSLSWSRLHAFGRKISPDGWPLTENTGLFAKLDTSPAAGVRFNVEYVVREVV